jgi:hypothetical protein
MACKTMPVRMSDHRVLESVAWIEFALRDARERAFKTIGVEAAERDLPFAVEKYPRQTRIRARTAHGSENQRRKTR